MLDFMKETVLRPMVQRLGTFAGAYLVGAGVNQDDTNTIVAGIVCAALVAFDLVAANRAKKRLF